jgi:hypothetical protein
LPSNTIVQLACDPKIDETCLAIDGPDLVPINVDTSDITVPPCGLIDFPAFTLRNVGNTEARARSGQMRHILYLSTTPEFLLDAATPINESEFFSAEGPLVPFDPETGEPEEQIRPTAFFATPEMTGGTFYLTPFVDYPLEVSEYIEPNNWTLYPRVGPEEIPIMVKLTVEEGFRFQGLQPPLVEKNSILYSNAGSAVPLVWQYLDPANPEVPIDSAEPTPSIFIQGFEGEMCGTHGNESPVTVLEDPGSSDIRYDATLMKWQFNWQTKNETGAKLRAGCYEISITANSTCAGQGEGPFLVQLD